MSNNDITGDRIASKPSSEAFRNRFDLIEWGKEKSELCAHEWELEPMTLSVACATYAWVCSKCGAQRPTLKEKENGLDTGTV